VDHAANEVHEEPQGPLTDHVCVDTKGFSSGPRGTSVLTSYADHVTARVWIGDAVICLIISYLNNYLSFYFN